MTNKTIKKSDTVTVSKDSQEYQDLVKHLNEAPTELKGKVVDIKESADIKGDTVTNKVYR